VGIAAQVIFVASWLAAASWQGPRYSVLAHSISEMYARTAPHAMFLVIVLTLCGAATIWFVLRSVRPAAHGPARTDTWRTAAVPPGRAGIWAAHAAGPGPQVLTWPVKSGTWTVVAMNANGSRPVSLRVTPAATLPALPWLAFGLLAGGFLVAAVGATLIVVTLRRVSRPSDR